MRILFICSSLEPGKDGVGDYIRRLGAELIRQGHQASALSLNDKFVQAAKKEIQCDGETAFNVLRTPASSQLSRNFESAAGYADDFKPDWLSLQFVIFGYHPKGLPFGIEKHLQHLIAGRRLHIMFHEIWVGITRRSTLKHKIYGFFQQRIIKMLISRLHPSLTTTTNGLYQAVLKSRHIDAEIIPLFSNIPAAPRDEALIRYAENQLGIAAGERSGYFIAGIFGSLYPGASLEKAVIEYMERAAEQNKKFIFIAIGRIGAEGARAFEQLREQFGEMVMFYSFGEQPPQAVSQILGIMDAGISCTPEEHIGKSGAFAAMRLHGLEVFIPQNNFVPEYDTIIKNYNSYLRARHPNEWSVEYIVPVFIKTLQGVSLN